MAQSSSSPANGPAQIFCPTCGRPLNESGKQIMRRESDWHGVRLQLSEKVFVGAVVAGANAIAALVAILLR